MLLLASHNFRQRVVSLVEAEAEVLAMAMAIAIASWLDRKNANFG